MSSPHEPIGHNLTDCKEPKPFQTHYPNHLQPYSSIERESVYRRPGLEERRIVEVQELTRGRQDSPPRERRRSSRSTNPPRHEMVLSQRGTLDPASAIRPLLTPSRSPQA